MKQYLPIKPVKWSIKVWVRADSVTGYFCDCEIYVGRPTEGTQREECLGERVVLQLTESLTGKNYQIFADNYFTTAHLLDTLQSCGLYGCGTTHPTRRGFPETLKNVSLERGKHAFYQRGYLVASVWMDKKPVTMLSTLVQADVTHTAERKRNGTRAYGSALMQ